VRESRRNRLARRKTNEVRAQPGLRIVEQREHVRVRADGRVVAARQSVSRRDLAVEELVQRDPEAGRQLEQRLERESTQAALGL
jgi:hypothetical protein